MLSALLALAALLPPAAAAPAEPPAGLKCLLAAYPEALCGARGNTLVWCDGAEMPFDDGQDKPTLDARLQHADLEDQLADRYPVGRDRGTPPPVDFDPGRVRYEPFFEKLYGASPKEVRSRLKRVRWLSKEATSGAPQYVEISSVNGVHEKLAAVAAELERLPEALRRVARHPNGTFNWRKIAGTDRRSMHSYAVAIDPAVDASDYWRWNKPDAGGRYAWKNRVPWEIVEIFERHGFIWGGKWYHFDTMHFEYRPELLVAPCVDAGDPR